MPWQFRRPPLQANGPRNEVGLLAERDWKFMTKAKKIDAIVECGDESDVETPTKLQNCNNNNINCWPSASCRVVTTKPPPSTF